MSILLFLVIFIPTLVLQQWLHRHIQGVGLALTGNAGCATRLLFYLLLPGILVHEGSHFLAAKILLVKTTGVSIGVARTTKKNVSLGSVNVARSDPLRESLIGIAPFVVGIGAIWLIAGIGFDLWPGQGLNLDKFIRSVMQYARDWTTWLGVYLIFAVSTSMIPSESDREPWGPVLTFIGALVAILFLLGWTPAVPPRVIESARQFIDALNFALGVALVVNACVAFALWLSERMLGRVSGRRVEYRVKRR
ncbi:MAG: hypothetical protein HY327_10595 [Chloroflexi bacterium]|nr:hypothetical protein [Chloroflexota bacterium]